MKWEKKGLIYCANNNNSWAKQGAALPVPYLYSDRILRIYVAFIGDNNVGRIGYIDVNPDNPKEVFKISEKPILDIGIDGTFDDNGVAPISIVKNGNLLYLYYVGFQLGVKRPYYLFSNLAISEDNGDTFYKHQQTPLLDRSSNELFIRTAPFVIQTANKWKMWYLGGSEWLSSNGKLLPIYKLKYLESANGIEWGNEGKLVMDIKSGEHGFGRPSIIKENDLYKMIYSIRYISKGYRLGYAESIDGVNWIRKDNEMKLDVSSDGWDSEMICYGSIFMHKNHTFLFYNGNGYGKTGVGYAELTK